jgi:hypothetical protein
MANDGTLAPHLTFSSVVTKGTASLHFLKNSKENRRSMGITSVPDWVCFEIEPDLDPWTNNLTSRIVLGI